MLFWSIGASIREILKEKRAENGKEIVQILPGQLGWYHFLEILPPQCVDRKTRSLRTPAITYALDLIFNDSHTTSLTPMF